MTRARIALAALAMLAGCGGGGSGGAPTAPAAVSYAPTIAAVGDSTQTATLTDAAQALLRQWSGDPTITIRNESHPGTSVAQMLAGTDGSGMPWPARLDAMGAHLVTINHAHNSVVEGFRQDVTAAVTIAQGKGARVMLQTPNPTLTDAATTDALAQIIRDVAVSTGADLCDVNGAMYAAGLVTPAEYFDAIHPREHAQAFAGQTLGACIFKATGGR